MFKVNIRESAKVEKLPSSMKNFTTLSAKRVNNDFVLSGYMNLSFNSIDAKALTSRKCPACNIKSDFYYTKYLYLSIMVSVHTKQYFIKQFPASFPSAFHVQFIAIRFPVPPIFQF